MAKGYTHKAPVHINRDIEVYELEQANNKLMRENARLESAVILLGGEGRDKILKVMEQMVWEQSLFERIHRHTGARSTAKEMYDFVRNTAFKNCTEGG